MPDSVTQAIADACFLLFRGQLIWCVHKLAVPCDSRLFKKSYNLGVTFNGSGDWQKVCVCVLSHLVIWQCWQTATQATDSYSSSLIKAPSLASKQTPTALLSSTHSCTHAVKNHEQGFLDKEKLTHTYESARYNQVNNCSAMIKTR